MVKEVSKKRKVAKAYADAVYDARKNFDVLHGAGIEPAIKLRKNASTKSHGCPARREEALLVKRLGYEGMERAEGLWEEVARGDRLLLVQEGTRRDTPLEEIPNPEGRSLHQGHALQQVPVHTTVDPKRGAENTLQGDD